jgi:hypothetical protein
MLGYLKWKLESFLGILKFIDNHPNVSTDIPEMDDDVSDLRETVAAIVAAEQIQGSNIEGVTQETKDKKKLMARTVIGIAHKARPLARRAKKWELFKKLDFAIYYIGHAPKVDAVSRAKEIQQVITENGAFFTNIKPADFTAMTNTINAYSEAQSAPRAAKEHKKALGTDALAELYIKGNDAADNIYDFVFGYYELTNPGLLDELDLNCGIQREGVRHNGISALCVDGNPPAGAITHLLQDVELKIVELNKTAKSDINGIAVLTKFKHGTYHIEFSKAGFVTKQMIVFVKRGQTVELEVEMERVV